MQLFVYRQDISDAHGSLDMVSMHSLSL